MLKPKLVCIWVILNKLFKITLADASRLTSITKRTPSRLDSSRTAVIPSIRFSWTKRTICSWTFVLLTIYGNSVTTIRSRPVLVSSISVRERRTIDPLPVSYASWIPDLPITRAPVGKSGPGKTSIKSLVVTSGLSMTSLTASMVSPKLWGGILVAIPTAIPVAPLTKRFGKRAGKTTGSRSLAS